MAINPGWLDKYDSSYRVLLPFVQSGVMEGESANAMYKTFQSEGFGKNRSTFLNFVRDVKESFTNVNPVFNSDGSKYDIIDMIPPSRTQALGKFTYTVSADIYNLDIDETYNQPFKIVSEDLLSEDELIEAYDRIAQEYPYLAGIISGTYSIDSVVKSVSPYTQ